MKQFLFAVGLGLATIPAAAETIAPKEAQSHVGQSVTVEGKVANVHSIPDSGVIFIDIGGTYPNQAITGVILKTDAGKFPNVQSLTGKVVDITGQVELYKGQAQILVNDPAQLKIK